MTRYKGKGLVIVGAQWGDEGKGKLVDYYAQESGIVARYQGGANAGHTLVVKGKKTVLHLVPSGILHPEKVCAIGAGCVVDPQTLMTELLELEAAGVDLHGSDAGRTPRFHLSHHANILMPYHRTTDAQRERGANKIGTTGRGIGPCYEDAVARRGIRFCDLGDTDLLTKKLQHVADHLCIPDGEQERFLEYNFGVLEEAKANLGEYITDVGALIHNGLLTGTNVLFEGAQGTFLDVLHGTYPYVTSSSTVAANAALGTGVGPFALTDVVGVTKAYTTRVGSGPFPTEQDNEVGERIRAKGAEFGATTGRARRCGWLDIPMLRYAARVNSMSELAVMKLDVLSGMSEIPVCVSYTGSNDLSGEFPIDDADKATPVYKTMPGWTEDITQCRKLRDLPYNALAYIDMIESLTDVPVKVASVGPDREATIIMFK